jgi:hypothetical protein
MSNHVYVPPRSRPKRLFGVGIVGWFWAAYLVVLAVGASIMLWAVFGR